MRAGLNIKPRGERGLAPAGTAAPAARSPHRRVPPAPRPPAGEGPAGARRGESSARHPPRRPFVPRGDPHPAAPSRPWGPATYQLPAAAASPGAAQAGGGAGAGPIPPAASAGPGAASPPSRRAPALGGALRAGRGGAERRLPQVDPAAGSRRSVFASLRVRLAPQRSRRCRRRPCPPAAAGAPPRRPSPVGPAPGPSLRAASPAGRRPGAPCGASPPCLLLYCCFRVFPEVNRILFFFILVFVRRALALRVAQGLPYPHPGSGWEVSGCGRGTSAAPTAPGSLSPVSRSPGPFSEGPQEWCEPPGSLLPSQDISSESSAVSHPRCPIRQIFEFNCQTHSLHGF
ncbi:basic proline-rich protein-like [Pseudopipra pipra]|uniref:basic proline-rich protein-like n=1 Tax=Pseudopipra pipra TaxID=415032 RepID=UPI003139DD5F